jgi:cytoplasmic iron level regulating protein YaaA (DUF328/UPF0246 family)
VLILLPPSETKRDGGTASSRLDLATLSFPALTEQRALALATLTELSLDAEASSKALGLGPALAFEIERNRVLHTSELLPTMDRYTGVLYDALEAESLTPDARAFLGEHMVVGSALFGLIRGRDEIPAYRLSAGSRLPGLKLKPHWRQGISAELAAHNGLILDLRSESYSALGPVQHPGPTAYLRVVSQGADGARRALNHFNKKGKGLFVRALATSGVVLDTVDELLDWAAANNITLTRGADGELDLLV